MDTIYEYITPLIIILVLLVIVVITLFILFTLKRKSERELKKAYEKEKAALVLAEKASTTKGNFMSRMSHEIRTPLNAVIGYNSIARSELTSAKDEAELRQATMKVMDCLTKSDIASRHLLTIINDVLDMSAIESGRIKITNERFDFKNLINSLTVLFFSQAKAKNLDFEVIFDTLTEEWFLGDQTRINQVLTNLLSNAIKFTPPGGSVKLKICQLQADDKSVLMHFDVMDTGIGMSPEYQTHLWTPFEQESIAISRNYGGTGLGLSITKNLVDLMQGEIVVESEVNKGTTFHLNLTFGRTQQPMKSTAYDFAEINALVVDDDESTCDYVRLLFDRLGARCTTSSSGSDALELIIEKKENNDPFTICMIDWQMPGLDGVETVKRLRGLVGEDLLVIIVTAYDYAEIETQAKGAGVNMFMTKPLFQSALFDLLVNISGKSIDKEIDPNEEFDFSGVRVLLAEDNRMNMEVAKRILSSTGLTIDSAWNGKEALAMFSSSPEDTYQAILMDVQMPEMNGYEATRAIRNSDHPQAETIPIIAMTADSFAENVAQALASGMNDHISKPIENKKLFEAIRRHL